jgi:hypothetical protein
MVNTFITSNSLVECASVLDVKRLGKQRLECKEIINILLGVSDGWSNHPAAKMWIGYVDALKVYCNHIVREWVFRGYDNNFEIYKFEDESAVLFPWWFVWAPFQLTHKCSLLRKDPDFYSQKFKLTSQEAEFMELGYIWPSNLTNEQISLIQCDKIDPKTLCSPIGCGAPAKYRWKEDVVSQWLQNPLINPKTGRKINPNAKSGIYQDLMQAAKQYGLMA